MNGRCEKNALDRAEDICELCGDQFCASCLLYPRGHRSAPTCKGCALANSGLRGRGGGNQPIGKREYKKRKKALLEQLVDVVIESPAIEYFDLADPSAFGKTTELDRRPDVIEEPETIDILGRVDDASPPPEPPPPEPPLAPRSDAPAPPPPAASAHAPPPPPPPSAAEEPVHAFTGITPVDTSVNPLALGTQPRQPPSEPTPAPAAASEASATAAELLARLKADQPIQSQYSSPRSLDADPFGAAAPHTSSAPQTVPPPTTPAQGISPTHDPFAPAAHSSPSPNDAAPAPAKIQPWTPPVPPPRGSNLDAMDASTIDNLVSAPSMATAAAPRAAPVPVPVPEVPVIAPAEPAPVPEALRPATPVAADTGEDPAPDRAPADTDGSGKWIPPSLRGMASAEERAADPLPKRR